MENRNKTFLMIAAAMILGILLGCLLFAPSEESGINGSELNKVEKEESTWTCSMHPQIRKNEPGDCPICGMELIPLTNGNTELNSMAVSMSPAAMELASVQTTTVGIGKAEAAIRLNGKVQVDERLLVNQATHIPGRLEKLNVNFTGEFISKGQLIAYIYSPDLITAQEELYEAEKVKDLHPALFMAAKEKLKNWKLSEAQIEELLVNKQIVDRFPVRANVSGYVTKKKVQQGDYVKQGEILYELADLSKVWVLFDVHESDMALVRQGDSLTYTIQSLPGRKFKGIIRYIDPVIDASTRVAKARVEVSNQDMIFKPEMFASATIKAKVAGKELTLVLPETAVMWTGKRSIVYVMETSDKGPGFLLREVSLGPKLGDNYVIEAGLEVGEEVVVNGTFSVDAAAQLAGKPSMMNPKGGHAATGHQHATHSSIPMQNGSEGGDKFSLDAEAKEKIKALFHHYFEIKEALVNDDLKRAKEGSNTFYHSLEEFKPAWLNEEARVFWLKQSALLKEHSRHLEHLKDLEAFRESFIKLSITMITIARAFEPFDSPIYVQYCPMANNNKGADWLSKEKEIRNPYFGASMIGCGEIKQEIN